MIVGKLLRFDMIQIYQMEQVPVDLHCAIKMSCFKALNCLLRSLY